MDLAASEALERVRSWERKNLKISCLISFAVVDMIVALNGRVSVRQGNIVLTSCGGCGLYLLPVETMTFRYSNGYLMINGLGWQCALWEPDDQGELPEDPSDITVNLKARVGPSDLTTAKSLSDVRSRRGARRALS